MNEADIIKSLECCRDSKNLEECGMCAYVECLTDKGCLGELLTDALDLINRQKAEIERFSRAIHNMSITTEVQMRAENEFQWLQINRVKQARAEAITEFKKLTYEACAKYGHKDKFNKAVFLNIIDQIAKELKEGVNNA